jgi:DNA-binding transcriptional MerR regulator
MEVFLSAADAGRLVQLTPSAIRQMERRGDLKAAARTEGGIRLFRRADVERLAKKRAAKRTTDGK